MDNGSRRECLALLEEIRAKHDCEIVYNGRNLGISQALNIGVDFAVKDRADWIITFDQDSRVSDGFVAEMLRTYFDNPSQDQIAMLLPTYIDSSSRIDLVQMRCPYVTKDGVILTGITSGAMTKTKVFESCGRFREDLFIDGVDTEFCLRVNRYGWKLIQSKNAVLVHSLGRISSPELWGRKRRTTNHNAGRRYYITRNRLLLWWLYLRIYPAWVITDIRSFFGEAINLLLVEDDRAAKVRAVLQGIRDAFLGRFGYTVKL